MKQFKLSTQDETLTFGNDVIKFDEFVKYSGNKLRLITGEILDLRDDIVKKLSVIDGKLAYDGKIINEKLPSLLDNLSVVDGKLQLNGVNVDTDTHIEIPAVVKSLGTDEFGNLTYNGHLVGNVVKESISTDDGFTVLGSALTTVTGEITEEEKEIEDSNVTLSLSDFKQTTITYEDVEDDSDTIDGADLADGATVTLTQADGKNYVKYQLIANNLSDGATVTVNGVEQTIDTQDGSDVTFTVQSVDTDTLEITLDGTVDTLDYTTYIQEAIETTSFVPKTLTQDDDKENYSKIEIKVTNLNGSTVKVNGETLTEDETVDNVTTFKSLIVNARTLNIEIDNDIDNLEYKTYRKVTVVNDTREWHYHDVTVNQDPGETNWIEFTPTIIGNDNATLYYSFDGENFETYTGGSVTCDTNSLTFRVDAVVTQIDVSVKQIGKITPELMSKALYDLIKGDSGSENISKFINEYEKIYKE